MQKRLLMKSLAAVFVITGLLLTTACSKSAIRADSSLTQEKAVAEERTVLAPPEVVKDVFLNEDIYFEFDSAILTSEAQEILKKKAEWLINNPNASIVMIIEGHCDERGTSEYNIALGDRRAESAKTFLMDLGVKGLQLSCVSYGEELPVDPGHNEEAWSKNRRDHFVIE